MAFTILKEFVAKPPLDNAAQQMTKVIEWAAQDAGPMLPIRNKEALEFLKAVKGDIDKKKCTKPLLRLGTDAGHLVMRIEGDPKYEKSVVVAKGYVEHKAKNKTATVVNAQTGDRIIDSASKAVAGAKGTADASDAEADLNAKGNKTPIILLAHGTPSSSLAGNVFAKDFAKQTAEQIVDYIAVKKKLSKGFSSVIYLDGCFTAAGPKQGRVASELNNFAGKVYAGLVKAGYKHLQVKGNLGAAATSADGSSERVIEAQSEASARAIKDSPEFKRLLAERIDLRKKATEAKEREARLAKVATALSDKHKGNAVSLKADIGLKLVAEEMTKLQAFCDAAEKHRKDLTDQLTALGPSQPVVLDDLVGVFGPEKISSKPWYRKLFG